MPANIDNNPAPEGNGGNALYISGSLKTATWEDRGYPIVISNGGPGRLVKSGETLTIDPGVEVKIASPVGFEVSGALNATGAAGDHVIFTASTDDSVGGDTNMDGNTQPVAGTWKGLNFLTGSASSNVEHAEVRYGGYGPSYNRAPGLSQACPCTTPVRVRNTTFADLAGNGVVYNGTPGAAAGGGGAVEESKFRRIAGSYAMSTQASAPYPNFRYNDLNCASGYGAPRAAALTSAVLTPTRWHSR